MVLAPAFAEAEVAIAERAGDRDLADIGRAGERGRRGLERRQPARDLAGLVLDPFRLVALGRAKAPLVDLQDRRIQDAVGERLQAQRRKARLASFGMMRPPPARWSRYSRITRESNRVLPSSSTSVGILPIGFCWRTVLEGLVVSAGSTLMSFSSPSTLAAMRILRTNGDDGEERRIIMGKRRDFAAATDTVPSRPARTCGKPQLCPRETSTRDDEIDGLGALALLVWLHIEGDALSFVQ